MIFKASKLITSENMHKLLERSEKFDVIEETYEFAKIPIRYKKPPVVLAFEYTKEMTKRNDLLVCMSRKNKQPDKENCEKFAIKPKIL